MNRVKFLRIKSGCRNEIPPHPDINLEARQGWHTLPDLNRKLFLHYFMTRMRFVALQLGYGGIAIVLRQNSEEKNATGLQF
jgi:hypothetical protein